MGSSCLRFLVVASLTGLFFGQAVGCSSKEAEVSGAVTLDGQPLTLGIVTFHPQSSGPLATGQIQADGNYHLETGTDEGLAVGSYLVTVEATEVSPPVNNQTEAIPKLLTPEKYRDKAKSGLTAEVKAGSNDVPLTLVSK